jgi:hypothetical protein
LRNTAGGRKDKQDGNFIERNCLILRKITPAVTLREHENRMVEEYRVNDNLYLHDQDHLKRGRALLSRGRRRLGVKMV